MLTPFNFPCSSTVDAVALCSLCTVNSLFWLGMAVVCYQLLTFVLFVWRHFAVPLLGSGNLSKKWGGDWAVVTGCTDGIGEAIARELAKKGMNIVLVSRSEEKLGVLSGSIETTFKVKTKMVAIDFSKLSVREWTPKIKASIQGISVGILVNNVGMSYDHPNYFHEISEEEISMLLSLNVESTNGMTHAVLPGMLGRKRGLVVNISSLAAVSPCPLLAVYAACKSYVIAFSEALDLEYSSKGIRVQCFTPGFVVSKLSKICRPDMMTPTPSAFAKSAIAQFGGRTVESPYLVHAIIVWLMVTLPSMVSNSIVMSTHQNILKRALKKKTM